MDITQKIVDIIQNNHCKIFTAIDSDFNGIEFESIYIFTRKGMLEINVRSHNILKPNYFNLDEMNYIITKIKWSTYFNLLMPFSDGINIIENIDMDLVHVALNSKLKLLHERNKQKYLVKLNQKNINMTKRLDKI